MTRTEAHALLNAAQSGMNVSKQRITQALIVTGDMDPPSFRFKTDLVPEAAPLPGDEPVVLHRPAGAWEKRAKGMAPAEWFEVIA